MQNKAAPVALRDYVIMSSTGSGSSSTETTDSSKTVTHREMYAVTDRMIAELDRRFTDNEVQLAACDTIFPGSPNFLNFELMAPLAKQFGPNLSIDSDKLKPQIAVISEMLKGIKVETAEDILQLLWPMKSAFPDAVRFFQLVLTLPVSSAQAERSFSSMKRVKNYLRSTMSQQRLTNLCLLSIERELSDTLLSDLSPLVDKFAEMKDRKLNLVM